MGGNERRILVVDDDGDILDLLKYNLEREGFKVKTLATGTRAVPVATRFRPDLIILDVMMPQINGLEVCASLRNIQDFSDTYIFFLTARSGTDQQAIFDKGGDDYIEKVMGLRSLIYKINSVLKNRLTIRKRVHCVSLDNISVDRKSHSAVIDNRRITLGHDEFELLYFFAQNPGLVISLETVVKNIWGSDMYVIETSVEHYMHSLQRKLGSNVIQRMQKNHYKLAAVTDARS